MSNFSKITQDPKVQPPSRVLMCNRCELFPFFNFSHPFYEQYYYLAENNVYFICVFNISAHLEIAYFKTLQKL